jgi:hypothetical protein
LKSRPPDANKLFDTILEVIDPKSHAVLASTRLTPRLERFLGDGLLASYREDGMGWPFIQIWRIGLERIQKGGTP